MKQSPERMPFTSENVGSILVLDFGASVAQWSVRPPFTSELAGSILSENFLNVARTQCSTYVKRVKSTLWFPPTGKLTGWIRINTDREVKSQLL